MDLSGHSYDDIMRLTDNLSQRYVIGFGASSTVYKCILKSGKPLAVKKLYHNYQPNTHEFEAELDTVGRIKHRNLVSLQGYSLSPHGNLLFYEFMENGSLWDLLHGMFPAYYYGVTWL
jgi:serine/threonine protein kinase